MIAGPATASMPQIKFHEISFLNFASVECAVQLTAVSIYIQVFGGDSLITLSYQSCASIKLFGEYTLLCCPSFDNLVEF